MCNDIITIKILNFIFTISVVIKAKKPKHLKITGFVATLHSINSSLCGVGKFMGSRMRFAGAPTVEMGCDQPLIMGNSSRPVVKKSSDTKWIAPRCKNPGFIMIKLV